MKNLRETQIARIDFAVDGTELDDAAWKLRRSSLLKRLHTQLPVLRDLIVDFRAILTPRLFIQY